MLRWAWAILQEGHSPSSPPLHVSLSGEDKLAWVKPVVIPGMMQLTMRDQHTDSILPQCGNGNLQAIPAGWL